MASQIKVPDLIHLEQCVNERLGTDSPPSISADLLPESGKWRSLAWARVPREEAEVLGDAPERAEALLAALDGHDGTLLFPLHPLVEQKYPPSSIVQRGRFTVSASYRTVFVEPDAGSPLAALVPPGQIMMIKLHLDDPLPGIAGDRRLSPEKVRKCVALSALLPRLIGSDTDVDVPAIVLREQFGLLHGERGAIVRFVPRHNLVPMFSLYSRDSSIGDIPPMLVSLVNQFGWSATETASRLAEWLARPVLSFVLAAYRHGFALEMHGQNTLIELSPEGRIDGVFFRDLESVVYFPELRVAQELAPLDLDDIGPELFQEPRDPRRWFNRNVDHDIGRIFRCTLQVLEREGMFDRRHTRLAVRSIRQCARRLITRFGVDALARPGRWLPYARSPYGKGFRRSNYYRTRFR